MALSNRKAIFDPDQAAESFASKQDRDTKDSVFKTGAGCCLSIYMKMY